MMFGHDDNQHRNENEDNKTPSPDGILAPDETTATAMPAAPLSNDDDAAGDFIMTSTPGSTNDTVTSSTALPKSDGASDDELLHIKQEAMQKLSPLLDHLDQSPEEKFRTTMMMIQAADNDKLIPVAYEAAKGISDEKARAQALLDIVNEINYFTQGNHSQTDSDKAV